MRTQGNGASAKTFAQRSMSAADAVVKAAAVGGGTTFAGLLALAGIAVYKKVFKKQRALVEEVRVLLKHRHHVPIADSFLPAVSPRIKSCWRQHATLKRQNERPKRRNATP